MPNASSPVTPPPRFRRPIWLWLVVFAYLLAGTTALAYEVLWARMLSLLFGVSIFGIAVTVAAFMAGLGAGSFVGTSISRKIRRPILFLAFLEIAVAIYAFNLPTVLPFVESSLIELDSGSLTAFYFVHALFALAALFVPAFLLGIGFSLAIRGTRVFDVSPGIIYGANTLGGVLGALLPLWLMPLFGWAVGLRLVAILGFFTAGLLLIASFRLGKTTTPSTTQASRAGVSMLPIIAYGLIGFAALILQIAWTRLFGMLFLQTEYVLGIILAVFLAGIGIGSLVAKYFRAPMWFTIFPFALVILGFAGIALLPLLGGLASELVYSSFAEALFSQGVLVALVTLPITVIFGIWYPLVVLNFSEQTMAPTWLYGANALGAALGAIVTAFLLLPLLGTVGSIAFALSLAVFASFAWGHRKSLSVAVLLSLIGAVFFHNLPELKTLQPSLYANSQDKFSAEDAINITHVVEKESGERLLLADLQRMDASDEPTAVEAQKNQARLPLMLHPEPKSILFLGLGTGITAAGSLPYPDLRRVSVEISEGAIAAADKWFAAANASVLSSTTIVKDDVRRYLQHTNESFDVIAGDLFHPDLVGRSSLLSRQQFERVSRRLNPNGVYVQWLALNQFDERSLDVVLRTFASVFPNAYIFVDGFRLALVAINTRQISSEALLANIRRLDAANARAALGNESPWTWLGRYWGKLTTTAGPIQDEWAPVIEFTIPKAKYTGDLDVAGLLKKLINTRPSMAEAADSLGIPGAARNDFEQAYLATELWLSGMVALFESKPDLAQKFLGMAFEANPVDRWLSLSIADIMFKSIAESPADEATQRTRFARILAIRPDHIETLKALWRLEQKAGNVAKAEDIKTQMVALHPGIRLR